MLRWRLVSGICMVSVVVLSMVLHGNLGGSSGWDWAGALIFTGMMVAFSWIAAGEFLNLTKACGVAGFPRLTQIFAVLLVLSVGILPVFFYPSPQQYAQRDGALLALNAILLTSFLVFGFGLAFRKGPLAHSILDLFISLAGLIYICWTLSFIPRLYFSNGLDHDGRWLALFLVAVTKSGDIGAYTFGMLTNKFLPGGNHKIETRISPKKSWEGLFGAAVFCVGAALLMLHFSPETHLHFRGIEVLGWRTAVFWGIFASLLGYWGDVAESALKRAANAKDSGRIPGLGGVLDVLDSLVLVAPFFYAYVQLIAITHK